MAWEDEALGLLVRRSGGHPYYVQLFGWHAWEAAQGEATITLAHAKAGLKSARAELAGQYDVTWGRLRPQERDYLAAVASLAGPGGAGVEEVAKVLGKEPKQLAVARDRLVHMHGLLEVPEQRPGPLCRRRDGRVGGRARRRHGDDHSCAEGAGPLRQPGP